jgi:hypothetical protein
VAAGEVIQRLGYDNAVDEEGNFSCTRRAGLADLYPRPQTARLDYFSRACT